MNPDTPGLRPRLMRWAAGLYPFVSGRPRFSVGPLANVLVPRTRRFVWTEVAGFRCAVNTADLVGRTALFFGEYDHKITLALQRSIERGDTVLDVGANIGVTALHAASLAGAEGRVVAFEPSPVVLPMIRATLLSNPTLPITLEEFGLGDQSGAFYMQVPDYNLGAGKIIGSVAAPDAVAIAVKRLDEYLALEGIDKVDVVKIDVEGFEPQVLAGLLDSPNAPRPKVIIFEGNDDNKYESFSVLEKFGYELFGIPDKILFRMKLKNRDFSGFNELSDFVAIHESAPQSRRQRLLA